MRRRRPHQGRHAESRDGDWSFGDCNALLRDGKHAQFCRFETAALPELPTCRSAAFHSAARAFHDAWNTIDLDPVQHLDAGASARTLDKISAGCGGMIIR